MVIASKRTGVFENVYIFAVIKMRTKDALVSALPSKVGLRCALLTGSV